MVSDWSSDVCSSDLVRSGQLNPDDVLRERGIEPTEFWAARQRQDALLDQLEIVQIGRASCRERV